MLVLNGFREQIHTNRSTILMISFDQALEIIADKATPLESETVRLNAAHNRILAEPVRALVSQPPAAMSAMDGYAVRFQDVASSSPNPLTVIGEAPAGAPFIGQVQAGQCVRVFTGSVIPGGADHVVIQEDTERHEDQVSLTFPQPTPRNIRQAGIDFSLGDTLLQAGETLSPAALALCAAANHAEILAIRRPRIAILGSGDELRPPGSVLNEGQIISSTPYALGALLSNWGADVVQLGIAGDSIEAIHDKLNLAGDVDVIIPIGGASVGDHDHMPAAFAARGLNSLFHKVAIKPGKPTWFGALDDALVLGLPGNPASALVCAHLFLKPLVFALTGRTAQAAHQWRQGILTAPLQANGKRESFLRGALKPDAQGQMRLSISRTQDSSLLTPFLTSNVLVKRPPDSPSQACGDLITCLLVD